MKTPEHFDALFLKAYAKARKVAYHFTTDRYLIDDLVQGFAVKVLSEPERYGPILTFGDSCNFGTVLNILRDEFRKIHRYEKRHFCVDGSENGNIENEAVLSLKVNEFQQLLPRLVQPNGKKDSALSLDRQNEILNAFRSGKHTTRELLSTFKISWATLNRITKSGIRAPKRPKAIEFFELSTFGYTAEEIANHFNTKPHNVSQQLYKIRELIRTKYQAEIF